DWGSRRDRRSGARLRLAPERAVSRLGGGRGAPPACARLPRPRPVVRGAPRRLHRPARVGAQRPRRHQVQAVTARLAVISDQHGNDVAFRTAVEDVERLGVEEIVCLGDVVQGGTEPAQTLDRLAALGCETVLGNADAFLLEVPADSPEPVTDRQLEVREWTLSQ